jgi:hypothetical protein
VFEERVQAIPRGKKVLLKSRNERKTNSNHSLSLVTVNVRWPAAPLFFVRKIDPTCTDIMLCLKSVNKKFQGKKTSH